MAIQIAVVLEPLEMSAGDLVLQRFDVADLSVDPDGGVPMDLYGRTARWSLARASGGSYSTDPEVDKDSAGDDVALEPAVIAGVAINAAGTGYAAGDVLGVVGGDGSQAFVRVDTVGGGGAVTAVTLIDSDGTNLYKTAPTSPAPAAIGANQTCTLTLTTGTVRGTVLVRMVRADTTALVGQFHQELEIVDADGEGQVVAVGDVTIAANVVNA